MNHESNKQDQTTAGFSLQGSLDRSTQIHSESLILTILCHPDPTRMGSEASLEVLRHGAGRLALGRHSLDFVRPGKKLGQPLDDPFMSRKPIWLSRLEDGALHIDPGACRTEIWVDGHYLKHGLTIPPEQLALGLPVILADRVMIWVQMEIRQEVRLPSYGMVGESSVMNQLRREIQSVSDLDVSILLRGPTGSGKERVAQAIHNHGPRHSEPFIAVNLGAIPPSLAAAELFGAVKGAYTGSQAARLGYFAAAHRGTLFLDEVGEAQPELQAMLLRVLETGECYPVGAATPKKVDVRILAATDAALDEQVAKGLFREPLFHRLSGYSVWVPSLQRRKKDFGLLFRHFANEVLEEMGQPPWRSPSMLKGPAWLSPHIMAKLLTADWSGNVRQFKNVVRQLLIGNRGETTLHWTEAVANMLSPERENSHKPTTVEVVQGALKKSSFQRPSEIGEEELIAALRSSKWNFKAAATVLGISRASLYVLAAKSCQIRKAEHLTPAELEAAHKETQGDLDQMADFLSVSRQALAQRLRQEGF